MIAVEDLKRTHRATWAAGDYAAVAEEIDEVPPRDLLGRVQVSRGRGRARRRDRHRKRRATGRRRRRARRGRRPHSRAVRDRAAARLASSVLPSTGLRATRRQLPFEDESFDLVLSAFGVQFAPRHEIVAQELARVSRPGGRIGLVNWTPEGQIGELFKIMGSYLPAPPEYASPPPLWGNEEHVRGAVRGHLGRARVRPRAQPVAVRLRRALHRVHGDSLRPDAEGP